MKQTTAILMILLCASIATAANAFLRHALAGKLVWGGNLVAFLKEGIAVALQPSFLLGSSLFALATGIWVLIMAWFPLSFAYPAQIALVTVLTTICSWLIFSEKMTSLNWVGLVIIVVGVLLVRK